jgi:hypothetical protein
MMPTKHYFSRSARDQDDICPRSRYWGTVYEGLGLSPRGESEALLIGTALHAGLAALWRCGETSGELAAKLALPAMTETEEFQKLQQREQWLLRCFLYAYGKLVYERYIQEWEVLYVEQELFVERGYLVLLCQPDVILRHRQTGRIRYLEYKTTKLLTPRYIESWRYSPQLAAGIVAAEETLQLKIDECVMGFFDKGQPSRDGSYWNSPFTNYWLKSGNGTDELPDQWSEKRPQYFKGWERFEPWTVYPEPEAWVEKLLLIDENVVLGQMPESSPTVVHPDLVKEWIDYSFWREHEIATAMHGMQEEGWKEFDLPIAFPRRNRQCRPVIGNDCPFLNLCWNPGMAQDPVATGLYVPRTPHHRAERIALGLEE